MFLCLLSLTCILPVHASQTSMEPSAHPRTRSLPQQSMDQTGEGEEGGRGRSPLRAAGEAREDGDMGGEEGE